MTAYVLIKGGEVVQKDCNPREGFIAAPDSVIVGMHTDDGGKTFRNPPPAPLTVDDFHEALYRHFDATARADRWDSRQTLIQRAAFPGKWQPLALAFCAWVDECEVFALGLLNEVQAGTKPPPENEEAFLALLPSFNP